MSGKSLLSARMMLKSFGLILVIATAYLAGTLASPAFTQAPTPQYIEVGYMKVDAGKEQEYLELEQLWKSVHQELVKAGKKKSWSLYGVGFSGTQSEYNYVTVSVFDKWQDLENQYPNEFFTKAHPNMTLDEISVKTVNARQLVRNEVWTLIDHAGISLTETTNK